MTFVKLENSPTETSESDPAIIQTPSQDTSYDEANTPPPSSPHSTESLIDPADHASFQHDLATADDDFGDLEGDEAGDKKPTKKRKSWGQVLPEPKTCLPPR
jgi:transcriptional activator HAC1